MRSFSHVDKVNVVTVTYNSASTIDEFVAGLEAQAEFVGQLIVVDNGSTDSTLTILERHQSAGRVPIQIIKSANTGFAGGYATAGRSARYDSDRATLCLNPDVRLSEGVLERMLDSMAADPRAGIVTAPLVGLDGLPDSASIRRLPTLGRASIYAVLGRITPAKWRYNAVPHDASADVTPRSIEATTGALMLVAPRFRSLSSPIFDTDYWMYGEDLQLCADAHREGWRVLMVDARPSLHVKGVSSGKPRTYKSNKAFHDAMFLYFRKNFYRGRFATGLVWLAVQLRFWLSAFVSAAVIASREIQTQRGSA